jgi:hypothetical protein
MTEPQKSALCALAADTTRELNVLGHNGNTLGVNGAKVRVLKESNEVGFGSLLKGENSSTLEAQVRLKVLGNLTDKTLERRLADQKVGRFLVFADLTKSDSSRAVTVRLLDASGSGSRLASSLWCEEKSNARGLVVELYEVCHESRGRDLNESVCFVRFTMMRSWRFPWQ